MIKEFKQVFYFILIVFPKDTNFMYPTEMSIISMSGVPSVTYFKFLSWVGMMMLHNSIDQTSKNEDYKNAIWWNYEQEDGDTFYCK